MKPAVAVVLGTLAFGGLVTTCSVKDHLMRNAKETKQVVTPDWYLNNYRAFVSDDQAYVQAKSLIESTDLAIGRQEKMYEGTPIVSWPRDARESLEDKNFTRQGYVSQCNLAVKRYNERAQDITRHFGDFLQPFVDDQDMRPYLEKRLEPCN